MKYLLLLSGIFCCSSFAQAQTGWLRRFPTLYELFSVQPLPDGYALIATTSTQVYQVRVNLEGVTQDSMSLGPIPDDIVPTSDGGFFKGFLVSDTIRLQKLSSNGNLLWEQFLVDSLPQKDLRLVAVPDGSCYVLSAYKQPIGPGWVTTVRRVTGDGTTLWSLSKDGYGNWNYNYNTNRSIADAVVLPDSSCMIMTDDRWNPWQSAAHLYQVKPDGSDGYSLGIPLPPFGEGLSSHLSLARPVDDQNLLAFGDKITGSSGGHPSSTQWGFATLITRTNFLSTQETLYPPTHSVMGMTNYASRPIVAAPMPDGDMVVVEKKDHEAYLYRGSIDLKDTAWIRPLTVFGGFNEVRVKRPNRLLYPTPDHGAILGGVDNGGIFLMKTGLWGNDTTASFFPFSGQLVEDQDLDCQTIGPYTPMVNANVRFSSADYPGLHWKVRTDSFGQIAAYLPPGLWQAEATDHVAAIYGKDCLGSALFAVADSLSAPDFTLPVLRYRARLSGQIWNDQNGNCLMDEGNSGLGGQAIMLTKDGTAYTIYADNQGFFSVAVDTGRYEAQISYRDANVFSGFYCQPTDAHLSNYQSSDSIQLIYSGLKDCKVKIALQQDVNFDCQPDSNQPFDGLGIQLTDTVTGTQSCYYPNFGTTNYTVNIYGSGTLKIDFCPNFPDSLKCSLPRYFNFQFDQDHQIYSDTLRAHHPRFLDSLSICPGQWAYGAVGPNDTIVTSTAYFLGNIPILKYYYVSFLPAPVTHLYVIDTTLIADSLQTFHYPAVNGCDSTVYVHWSTTAAKTYSALPSLRLTPNPTSDKATLWLPTPDFYKVAIMDFSNRIVAEQMVAPTQTAVDLSFENASPGIYLVRAVRSDGGIAFGKIIVSQ